MTREKSINFTSTVQVLPITTSDAVEMHETASEWVVNTDCIIKNIIHITEKIENIIETRGTVNTDINNGALEDITVKDSNIISDEGNESYEQAQDLTNKSIYKSGYKHTNTAYKNITTSQR